MKKSLESRVIDAYSKAMLVKYSNFEFCINEYKEENICLNFIAGRWVLSIYERGNNRVIFNGCNLLDTCLACFNQLAKDKADEMKEIFLENI